VSGNSIGVGGGGGGVRNSVMSIGAAGKVFGGEKQGQAKQRVMTKQKINKNELQEEEDGTDIGTVTKTIDMSIFGAATMDIPTDDTTTTSTSSSSDPNAGKCYRGGCFSRARLCVAHNASPCPGESLDEQCTALRCQSEGDSQCMVVQASVVNGVPCGDKGQCVDGVCVDSADIDPAEGGDGGLWGLSRGATVAVFAAIAVCCLAGIIAFFRRCCRKNKVDVSGIYAGQQPGGDGDATIAASEAMNAERRARNQAIRENQELEVERSVRRERARARAREAGRG
jgi:hypothetical protein